MLYLNPIPNPTPLWTGPNFGSVNAPSRGSKCALTLGQQTHPNWVGQNIKAGIAVWFAAKEMRQLTQRASTCVKRCFSVAPIETQLVNLYCIFPRNMHIGIESSASNKYAAWLKLYNPLFRMVAWIISYEIVHVPTCMGWRGHPIFLDIKSFYMNSYILFACVCTCPPVSRGSVFNHVIPITKSFPRMTSLPYLGLVVLPLWTRSRIWQEGFPTSPCISVLGLRGSCLEAVPQSRNLSHQIFNTASCREGCSNYQGKIEHGVWALGDRRPAHFARVRWRSGNQVPILYGGTSRPHSMRVKARTRNQCGLMCGTNGQTQKRK